MPVPYGAAEYMAANEVRSWSLGFCGCRCHMMWLFDAVSQSSIATSLIFDDFNDPLTLRKKSKVENGKFQSFKAFHLRTLWPGPAGFAPMPGLLPSQCVECMSYVWATYRYHWYHDVPQEMENWEICLQTLSLLRTSPRLGSTCESLTSSLKIFVLNFFGAFPQFNPQSEGKNDMNKSL